MTTTQTGNSAEVTGHTLSTDKFLTISANILHKALIDSSRTDAKAIFRDVQEGKVVPLTRVRMEDGSEVRFDLSLDHSEYRGNFNFGAFRHGLAVLIAHIAEAVNDPAKLTTFGNQQDPRSVLFGVTAVTVEDGVSSVLALGADSAARAAAVQLKLMYLPHQQFEDGQGPDPETTA